MHTSVHTCCWLNSLLPLLAGLAGLAARFKRYAGRIKIRQYSIKKRSLCLCKVSKMTRKHVGPTNRMKKVVLTIVEKDIIYTYTHMYTYVYSNFDEEKRDLK